MEPETTAQPCKGLSASIMPLSHGRHHKDKLYESSAYFIENEHSGKSFLVFGDVEAGECIVSCRFTRVWKSPNGCYSCMCCLRLRFRCAVQSQDLARNGKAHHFRHFIHFLHRVLISSKLASCMAHNLYVYIDSHLMKSTFSEVLSSKVTAVWAPVTYLSL